MAAEFTMLPSARSPESAFPGDQMKARAKANASFDSFGIFIR